MFPLQSAPTQPALLISSELLVIACMELQFPARTAPVPSAQKSDADAASSAPVWGPVFRSKKYAIKGVGRTRGLPQGWLCRDRPWMPLPTDWLQFIVLSINVGPRFPPCVCLGAVCIIRKPKVIILSNWWICLFPRATPTPRPLTQSVVIGQKTPRMGGCGLLYTANARRLADRRMDRW